MGTPLDRLRDRYQHDAAFHQTVDMLQAIIHDVHLTPSEVREAATFACILIEERRLPDPVKLIHAVLCPTCGKSVLPLRNDTRGMFEGNNTFSVVGACGHTIPCTIVPFEPT